MDSHGPTRPQTTMDQINMIVYSSTILRKCHVPPLKTNMSPENWWLEDEISLRRMRWYVNFQWGISMYTEVDLPIESQIASPRLCGDQVYDSWLSHWGHQDYSHGEGRHGWYTKNRAFFGVPPKRQQFWWEKVADLSISIIFNAFLESIMSWDWRLLVRQIPSTSTGTAWDEGIELI